MVSALSLFLLIHFMSDIVASWNFLTAVKLNLCRYYYDQGFCTVFLL